MCKYGKYVFLLVITVLLIMLPMKTSAASNTLQIKNNNNGTLTINYNNIEKVKTKVLVRKGKSQYQYDLRRGKNTVRIPLTQGNGTYTVMLVKQVQGNSYSIVAQEYQILRLNPTRKAFTPRHIIINFEKTNSAIKKARTMVKGIKNKEMKIKKIYNYVVKTYRYDYGKIKKLQGATSAYVPNINKIYNDKKGICYDIAALFASMLRSVGIETKLMTGYSKLVDGYHAWNKVYNASNKKWMIIDCTYDLCMYKSKLKYKMTKKAKDYATEVYQY